MLFIIFFFQVKNAIQKNVKLIHVNSNIDKKNQARTWQTDNTSTNLNLYRRKRYHVSFTSLSLIEQSHCVKSACIRSFIGPYFPALREIQSRDTEYLFVFNPNVGKCGPEKVGIRTLFTK